MEASISTKVGLEIQSLLQYVPTAVRMSAGRKIPIFKETMHSVPDLGSAELTSPSQYGRIYGFKTLDGKHEVTVLAAPDRLLIRTHLSIPETGSADTFVDMIRKITEACHESDWSVASTSLDAQHHDLAIKKEVSDDDWSDGDVRVALGLQTGACVALLLMLAQETQGLLATNHAAAPQDDPVVTHEGDQVRL